MTPNPPRVPEILAGAFSVLLLLSLFLPWYRSSEGATACPPGRPDCPQDTATAFEAFAILDIVLLLVAAGGIALLILEMSQGTPAIPVAWSALLAPLAVVAFGLVLWRTAAPPGDGNEPVFALLGLIASGGLAAATVLSMRSEGYGSRSRSGGAELPERLPVPSAAGGARREGRQ